MVSYGKEEPNGKLSAAVVRFDVAFPTGGWAKITGAIERERLQRRGSTLLRYNLNRIFLR